MASAAAAAAAALYLDKDLQEELTCCLCLDFFNNPVLTVKCSHSFCKGCISQHCQNRKTQASCPKCRRKLHPNGFIDNRPLANIVEIFQQMKKAPGAWPREPDHWREDPEGRGSAGHPPHLLKDVVKISELPQQIERALETIANWRKDSTELMDYVSRVKSSIAEAFNIVKKHLNDREKMILNIIDKEYVPAKQKRDTMNEQLTIRLDQLLELQNKVIKDTSLGEEVCIGDPIKVNEVTLSVQKISSIACTVEEFKRNLVKLVVENFPAQQPNEPTPETSQIQMDVAEDEAASSSGSSWSQNSDPETSHSSSAVSSPIDRPVTNVSSQFSQWATDVTFDLKRINSRLELSEDKRRVVVSRFPPKYEHSAKRFRISQVMGSPGFSEGCHYWQVSTKDATGWAIGLADEEIGSTDQLGRTELSWCIEWSDGRLSAWHGKQETHISQEKPLQVGVFLDIPRNCVSFYSQMDTESCLHTFEINVANTVYPTFWIFGVDVGGSLTINEIKKC